MNLIGKSGNARQSISRKIKLFWLYGIVAAVGLAVLIIPHIILERKNDIEILKQDEMLHLEMGGKIFRKEIAEIINDLVFMSNSPGVKQLITHPDNNKIIGRVAKGFTLFAKTKKTYDQIRYINKNGQEVIQVNYNNGKMNTLRHDELQDKSNRYYFTETMGLGQGQIYISPLDLNIENGEIEVPYKPIVRIATPLFDTSGTRRGILIFNYFGNNLIDLFRGAFKHTFETTGLLHGEPIMLNRAGYWLHSPDPSEEWGFMLDHQKMFAKQHLDAWEVITGQENGQFITPNGLFSFSKVFPLGNEQEPDAYYWILAAQVPADELAKLSSLSRRFPLFTYFFFLALCAPFLWIFVSLKEENRQNIDNLAKREKKISHLNLVMQTIHKIHQTIIIERSVDSLVKKICTIFVANRGYYTAWIMLTDRDSTITTIVQSGFDGKFVKMAEELQEGRLPLCINKVMDAKDMITISGPDQTCSACFLRKNYKNRGVISGSLRFKDTVYGYLTVTVPLFLLKVDEEKDLFCEIANDIAYAIYSLKQREQRKRAEQNLYASEQRFKTLVSNIPQRIFHKDRDSVYVACNLSYAQDIGLEPDKIIGKTDYDFFSTEQAEKYRAEDQEVMQEGIIKDLEEQIVVNGSPSTIQTIKMPFVDKQGQTTGILGVYWDISDRKKTAEQLLQTEKMTTIAGLAAGVAHEINTPLSAIMQSAQLITQRLSPDLKKNIDIAEECGIDLDNIQKYLRKRELDYFLEGIHKSATSAGKIVSNLLQFSRPHSNDFTLVNLNEITDNALELAKTDFDLNKKYNINHINFIKEYGSDLPAVSCVKMEIEQVIINLIKNAVQALSEFESQKSEVSVQEEDRIILRTLYDGKNVRMEVEDNGPGIDEETRLHIFDPFFTTKDIGEGTGLGLYVCRSIVHDKHKGNVLVDSQPGQGATFTVELPIQ